MKKVIALFLAVLAVCSGCMFSAFAVDGDAPTTTPSGFYVGQKIKPGDEIKSSYATCERFVIEYSVDIADAENVTSEWQKKFSDDTVTGVANFCDDITPFAENEEYKGVYIVKGQGDVVGELETTKGVYKSAKDIYTSMDKDELKALRIKKQFDLTIDYDYAHTTRNQYTTITAWEIVSVDDFEDQLSLKVKAVFETREPTSREARQEKAYEHWLAFLDKVGDMLMKIVPKMIAFWAKVLGKNR